MSYKLATVEIQSNSNSECINYRVKPNTTIYQHSSEMRVLVPVNYSGTVAQMEAGSEMRLCLPPLNHVWGNVAMAGGSRMMFGTGQFIIMVGNSGMGVGDFKIKMEASSESTVNPITALVAKAKVKPITPKARMHFHNIAEHVQLDFTALKSNYWGRLYDNARRADININSNTLLACKPYHSLVNFTADIASELKLKLSGIVQGEAELTSTFSYKANTLEVIVEAEAALESKATTKTLVGVMMEPHKKLWGENTAYFPSGQAYLEILEIKPSLFPTDSGTYDYGQGTVEFWYYKRNHPLETGPLFELANVEDEIRIMENVNGDIYLQAKFGSTIENTAPEDLSLNTWHHIAIQFRDCVWGELYVDGFFVGRIGDGVIPLTYTFGRRWRFGSCVNDGFITSLRISDNLRYTAHPIKTASIALATYSSLSVVDETSGVCSSVINLTVKTHAVNDVGTAIYYKPTHRFLDDLNTYMRFDLDILEDKNGRVWNTAKGPDALWPVEGDTFTFEITEDLVHEKDPKSNRMPLPGTTLVSVPMPSMYIAEIRHETGWEDWSLEYTAPPNRVGGSYYLFFGDGTFPANNSIDIYGNDITSLSGLHVNIHHPLTLETDYRIDPQAGIVINPNEFLSQGQQFYFNTYQYPLFSDTDVEVYWQRVRCYDSQLISNFVVDHNNRNPVKRADSIISTTNTLYCDPWFSRLFTYINIVTNSTKLKPLIFEVEPAADNDYTVKFSTSGGKTLVDWGDSTGYEEFTNNAFAEHTYSSTGTQHISVVAFDENVVTVNNFYDTADVIGGTVLTKCIQWADNTNVHIRSSIFKSCTNLTSIPDTCPSYLTSLNGMFSSASSFNDPNISLWDVSNITNLGSTFQNATVFNQPLNDWDVSNVTSIGWMFSGSAFNSPIDKWDVDNVTYMRAAFRNTPFNQIVSGWNTGSATNMSLMFNGATSFNHYVNSWDVSNVRTMDSMFNTATSFNQSLDQWDVSNVEKLTYTFSNASSFNRDISMWDVSNVTDITAAFRYASSFNSPLNNWDVSNVASMSQTFKGATSFNHPLDQWNVYRVTNMDSMFYSALIFDQDISSWQPEPITSKPEYFDYNTLSSWTDAEKPQWGSYTILSNEFTLNCDAGSISGAASELYCNTFASILPVSSLQIEIEFESGSSNTFVLSSYYWEVHTLINWGDGNSEIVPEHTDLIHNYSSSGPYRITVENNDPNNYSTSILNFAKYNDSDSTAAVRRCIAFPYETGIELGSNLFEYCINLTSVPNALPPTLNSYRENLSGWFIGCTSFNDSNVSNWDVSDITDISAMFSGASSFNQPLNWDTRNIRDIRGVFSGASSFNQPLNWDTSNVIYANSAFSGASSFNQPLNWDTSNVTDMADMFYYALVFDQDISDWCVTYITTKPSYFDTNTPSTWTDAEKPNWGTCP